MRIEQFEELLDQYGWDLMSWPEVLRREANVLIAQDANAAELLRSLRSVEDILADDPLPMSKHKAIDDIFAAIEVEETQIAKMDQTVAHDPNDHFKPIDGRPKSRAHLTVTNATPVGGAPTRKTYPTKSSVSPVNSAISNDAAHFGGRTKGMLGLLGKSMFSGVGMVVCILAGFAFGVTMTVQQGRQVTAQADEVEMVDLFYALEPAPTDQGAQQPEKSGDLSEQGGKAE
ncbi:hypothetical protein ACQ0MK_16135 [Thalassospira lucentensis]|uniref:hypothetical protein n=1 Tax=Thalassospira lucentensis TaxID=168935 RepID=UPI003D2EE664